MPVEDPAVGCDGNRLVYALPDGRKKLPCPAKRDGFVPCSHELFRNGVASQCRKLASGRPCEAIRKSKTGTVGVYAPAADTSRTNGAGLLHNRDALVQQFCQTPKSMSRKQRRQSSRASTDNSYAYTIEAQCSLAWA